MIKAILGTVLLCLSTTSFASIILLEGFEDDLVTYTSSANDNLSELTSLDYYGRLQHSHSLSPSALQYSNRQGDGFYGVQDTDGVTGTPVSAVSLVWGNIDIANWTDLSLSWWLAEDKASDGNEDFDHDTQFLIETQIDNSGFRELFSIRALRVAADRFNHAAAVDDNFDGIGDGQRLNDSFQQFSRDLQLGNSLDIRVNFLNFNAGDEDIAFDQLMLSGNANIPASVKVNEPPTYLLFALVLLMLTLRGRHRFVLIGKGL